MLSSLFLYICLCVCFQAGEIYEKLTSQGQYTNLYTGQEVREIPFSTHIAATMEIAPTNEDFDIAVIDEIQMIDDASRGHAWTRALLGIRAKEVHVCGGLEVSLQSFNKLCSLKLIYVIIAYWCGTQEYFSKFFVYRLLIWSRNLSQIVGMSSS